MLDILTCKDGDYIGDLDITEDGDIQLADDIEQNVKTAVAWILDEWRLGPDIGLPYFDDIFVKNPNLDLIRQEITEAILDVDGVTDASVEILEFNSAERTISFSFSCTAGDDEETYSEEVTVSG